MYTFIEYAERDRAAESYECFRNTVKLDQFIESYVQEDTAVIMARLGP